MRGYFIVHSDDVVAVHAFPSATPAHLLMAPRRLLALALPALALGYTPALEGVANFRAVSPSLPGLYRSGTLESATVADVAYLLDGARIRTVVVRAGRETRTITPNHRSLDASHRVKHRICAMTTR